MADFQHIARAHRIPRVHHAIMAERDIDASGHQFGHPGHAAAFGIRVVTALQHDVDQRIGDHVHLRFCDQRDQFRDVVIVHRMHGCEVRACNAALQPVADGLLGEGFDMARVGVIGFIAMHIDG